jgi:diaminopimelate epimerase
MHGLGNDFIIPEISEKDISDLAQFANKLCNRHTGIGADGILLVCPSESCDIKMRIINSDGSEAEMCGNGIRCFAKYVYENRILNKSKFTIETLAGEIVPELFIQNGNVTNVRVRMNNPKFIENEDIEINIESESIASNSDKIHKQIQLNDSVFEITSLTLGVPHSIMYVEDIQKTNIKFIGPYIEKDKIFPKGTNVNFVQVLNENEIIMRTWERGAGQTLACGTGSCAAGVGAYFDGKTNKKITVHLELGDLDIEIKDKSIYMTGPAELVFEGTIELNF